VKPACEQAVEVAPEGAKGIFRDARGLARALTGDTARAIADFTAFLDYLKGQPNRVGYDQAFLNRRENWIAALKGGRNPFDERLRKALRLELDRPDDLIEWNLPRVQ
jgi:hypothetical protein